MYTDHVDTFDGNESEVLQQLYFQFPWLRPRTWDDRPSPEEVVDHLNGTQMFDASIESIDDNSDEAPDHLAGTGLEKSESTRDNLYDQAIQPDSQVVQDMLGINHKLTDAFQAARFLVSGNELPADVVRKSLYKHDGDIDAAALDAYGIPVTPQNLKALQAVREMSQARKSDAEASRPASYVLPAANDGDETAEMVERAFKDNFVFPVKLGGKHSDGSLLARDQHSGTVILLKPGANGVGPAAGARKQKASQSEREAAFFHVAENWGLGDFVPKTDLLIVDGKEYAAMHLLPWSYKTLDKIKHTDPNAPRRILDRYLKDGAIHKWAILDYVLGNPDRHGQNIMVGDGNELALIDHGSAFAGNDFNPAHDENSFVPYYLRAWAPLQFKDLPTDQKLRFMPHVANDVAEMLEGWLNGINEHALSNICHRYGVSAAACKGRLALIRMRVEAGDRVDDVINRLWIGA